MSEETEKQTPTKSAVTVEDVNRVLEVGRLLFSVLTQDEIKKLQQILNNSSDDSRKGNAGVT